MKKRKKLFAVVALFLWLAIPVVAGESSLPVSVTALIGFSVLFSAVLFTYLAGGFENERYQ